MNSCYGVVSHGELSVLEKFSSLLIDEDQYFMMSKQQNESAFTKFCNADLNDSEHALLKPKKAKSVNTNH